MIDAPDGEDRPVIRHQQGCRMSLVKGVRTGTDDHLAFLLAREIDDPKVGLVLSYDQRGQAEQGREQGAHGHSLRCA